MSLLPLRHRAGSQGFNIGRMMQSLRRGVHGNRASARVERTRTEAVDAAVQELRFVLPGTELTVTGEDRPDLAIQLAITSNGFDDAEAHRLAEASALSVTRAASTLVFAMNFPREGRQTAILTLKVPKRLRMRLDSMGGGKLEVSNLAGLEVMGMAGDMKVTNIAGPVVVNQRRGSVAIDGATSLKLTSRGDAKAEHVAGTITIQASGGELTLADIVGPAEIEARNTDVRMENLSAAESAAPNRREQRELEDCRAPNGRAESTVARPTSTSPSMRLSPATIYSTGENIVVTPPPGGYTLDAVASDGRITIDDDDDQAERQRGRTTRRRCRARRWTSAHAARDARGNHRPRATEVSSKRAELFGLLPEVCRRGRMDQRPQFCCKLHPSSRGSDAC